MSVRFRRRLAALTAAVFMVAGCGAVDGSRGVAGPEWAREAAAWISAFDAAAGSLGGDGPIRVTDFYAADVRFDTRYDEYYGRVAVTEVERSLVASSTRHDFGEIYLDGAGFVRTEALVWGERARSPLPTLRTWEMASEGVVQMQGYNWLDTGVVRDNPEFQGARALAGALSQEYVRAWAEADHAALREIYWAGASVVDSLYGVQVKGQEAIVALADPQTASPAHLDRAEDLYSEEVLSPLQPPRDAPAVYVTWNYMQPDERHPAQLLLLERSVETCPGASAVVLTVDTAGHVIAERRFHALASVRACVSARDLQPGWWTGRGLPVPLSERVTGRVDSGSGSIEIRNGTPELEEFVRWGLGRFAEAGLASPRVRTIAFDPFSPLCADYNGYTDASDGVTTIVICADAGDTAPRGPEEGDACAEASCPNISWSRRELLVHELGHAWLITHLDERTRDRFTAYVGASWDDPAVRAAQRGVELAASTLAWGLAGSSTERAGLGPRPCEVVAGGFRLLTGAEPLTACEGSVGLAGPRIGEG